MTHDKEQQEQLDHVNARIAHHVRDFVLAQRGEWTTEQLRRYVTARVPGAPASADRVLRDLRQRGVINYRNTSRRAATYVTVHEQEAA